MVSAEHETQIRACVNNAKNIYRHMKKLCPEWLGLSQNKTSSSSSESDVVVQVTDKRELDDKERKKLRRTKSASEFKIKKSPITFRRKKNISNDV